MSLIYNTKIFTEIYNDLNSFLNDYTHIGLPQTITTDNASVLYYLLYGKYGNSPIANLDENQFKYKLFSLVWQYGPTWQKRLDVQKILRELNLQDLISNGQIADVFAHTGTDSRSITESGEDSSSTENNQTTKTENDVETITNHALNPETTPATNAYDPLGYINEQTASKTDNDTDTQTWGGQSASGSHSNTTGVSSTDSANDTNTKTLTKGKLDAYEHLLALLDTDVTAEFINRFAVCFKQFVLPEKTILYVEED